MSEPTEPCASPGGRGWCIVCPFSGAKNSGSRWLPPLALLTALFASSAGWATDKTDLSEQPRQRRTVEAVFVAGGATERVFELPLSSGERQRVLYVAPRSPQASIVMLPGGAGNIGLTRNGDVRRDKNFVVRTRDEWVAKGYAVLIPDTIDHGNLRGVRSSPEYASVVGALVRFAGAQVPKPVFLLGTSQGSIAAANGAAHAPPGTLAGVVLTESVSRLGNSHETVFDADLQNIHVPAFVVANRDDRCKVAPPKDAPGIAAAMNHSPDVRIAEVRGGIDASSDDCASLTPHGYYGIEAQVVETISDWIRGRLQ